MDSATLIASHDRGKAPVEDWLRALPQDNTPSRAIHAALQAVIVDPKFASYASAGKLAARAGVNVATVTRAAQSFGFSGWPEWQQEIRARYLGQLNAPELALEHEISVAPTPFDATINKHLGHLTSMRRGVDRRLISDFAKAIATAQRRLIVASGSYGAAGKILAHHAGIAGYRCEVLEDSIAITHALADITDKDLVIPMTFWRLFNSSIAAAKEARRRGTPVYLITDQMVSPIAELATKILVVPSEGASFFPSILPTLSLIEGISAELVRIDPAHSNKAIAQAERQWQDFGLLFFNSPNFPSA
ncbi:MurR/RpiR family transcriptional regulator [Mesorhizobium sp. VK23B]|uniref:MurR/RpiR family transcriptional regulator n=1 Tax=Mesorhizobium dulcispinae TaxID=3072316 RepID=A0ABU4XQE7_9HYPH|nr:MULTISPECIES: MurR/RpiR family transcriptional regulator [unclassified Mesorhizobium]MDX8469721.1 MurR/RpiR family transcriptional regulator [Mesorhizobium sp. VK23B]MDX8476060.1 MurR/RpiR family transcriptional regulator [Mesorhizobium sp. VK23A]